MSEKKELAITYEVDGNPIKLTPSIVQSYIVGTDSKISLPEFKFFTEMCKVRRLNPFLKEAYCIKYGNQPAQLIVSKDVIQRRAIENPKYDGIESGIIVQDEKGVITERAGLFYTDTEKVIGGWAKVYRKDWSVPVYVAVSVKESAQKKKEGNFNTMWATKTATMIEKVAKVRAWREAFTDDLAGLYDADEMGVELPIEATVVENPPPNAADDMPNAPETFDDV